MSRDYQIGEHVVYGSSGVCKIEEIRRGYRLMDDIPPADYYVLKPLSSASSTVFVPLGSDTASKKMRPVLSKSEIDELIASVGTDAIYWIDDRKERLSAFRAVLQQGDRRDQILLIRCILLRVRELEAKRRHLATADSDILQAAQRAVREEFAFALGLRPDAVPEYVRNGLAQNNSI